MFVDVHAHLTHNLFSQDIDEVLIKAKDANVVSILCSGVNRPTNEECLDLSRKYDIVKCCMGLYPIDLLGLKQDGSGLSHQNNIDLNEELEYINKHKDYITAIGEVGLDYHWDKDNHKLQKDNFQKIIKFTEKINLPMVVHTRKAEQDCLDIIESSNVKDVVLHSFGGNKRLIKRAVDMGMNFSVPAVITRLMHFETLVKIVPLTQILTETDSPWLSPLKGVRNEPVNVVKGVKKIALTLELDAKETEDQIYSNYKRIFKK